MSRTPMARTVHVVDDHDQRLDSWMASTVSSTPPTSNAASTYRIRLPGIATLTGLATRTRTSESSATGTLSQNTARQVQSSASTPPTTGPTTRNSWLIPAYAAMARPRAAGANAEITMAAQGGIKRADPVPRPAGAGMEQ